MSGSFGATSVMMRKASSPLGTVRRPIQATLVDRVAAKAYLRVVDVELVPQMPGQMLAHDDDVGP